MTLCDLRCDCTRRIEGRTPDREKPGLAWPVALAVVRLGSEFEASLVRGTARELAPPVRAGSMGDSLSGERGEEGSGEEMVADMV